MADIGIIDEGNDNDAPPASHPIEEGAVEERDDEEGRSTLALTDRRVLFRIFIVGHVAIDVAMDSVWVGFYIIFPPSKRLITMD